MQQQTVADTVCWQSPCIVHDEFKAQALATMKALYPDAAVLVHSESPHSIVELADVVDSISQLIVARDCGIFYRLQQACSEKTYWQHRRPDKEQRAGVVHIVHGWQ